MRVYFGLRDKSLWEFCGILEVINDEVLFYIWNFSFIESLNEVKVISYM